MSHPPVLVERCGAVTILSINDAPYNRPSLAFMDELETLVESLAHDDAVRAVVIKGYEGGRMKGGFSVMLKAQSQT